jgi:hypothetical protein
MVQGLEKRRIGRAIDNEIGGLVHVIIKRNKVEQITLWARVNRDGNRHIQHVRIGRVV